MKITRERMFYIAAVIVTASVIASSMIAVMTTNTSLKAESHTSDVQQEMTYVLSEKDGRVAGFVKGVEIPLIRTDTPVNSLPYDIQQKLRKGLEFDTEEELRRKIEEWCS